MEYKDYEGIYILHAGAHTHTHTQTQTHNTQLYIYIYISLSSSSCRAGSTYIPDPLSPLFPIVHCL